MSRPADSETVPNPPTRLGVSETGEPWEYVRTTPVPQSPARLGVPEPATQGWLAWLLEWFRR